MAHINKSIDDYANLLPEFKDKEGSIENLQKAIDGGYKNLDRIVNDDSFNLLHNDSRYETLIAKMKAG